MTNATESGSSPLQRKLKSLDDLGAITREARWNGASVVLAHGTFDLLHVGHIRHLRQARREGDLLIVTLTADAFVSKGPGRPVFSEHMRAEMLASLECVDYVGIVRHARAVPAIEAIRPSVYVKGSEYANPDDDVTGGIVEERAAVEADGGRIAFTDDITYSSTALINRHLAVFDPILDEYLEAHREKGSLRDLSDLVERVRDMRVLLIGDAIIDDYKYVAAIGKSPKEHIIATQFHDREVFAGGVFAAANHMADFCKRVDVVTTIGKGCPYKRLIRDVLRPNVKLHAFERDGAPTTRKTRYVDRSYLRKLFEVYYMDDAPTAPALEKDIDRLLRARMEDADLVVVTDFGHGLLTPALIGTLTGQARFLAVNTQTNSANIGFNLITKYGRADYVCIDAPEARLAVADRLSDVETIAGDILPGRLACPRIMITHGRHGCVGWQKGRDPVRVPAFTGTVVDTVGAGDAFFAVSALMAAAGGTIDQLAFIGNAAGAIKVGIVGHRNSVERVPLLKFLTTLLK